MKKENKKSEIESKGNVGESPFSKEQISTIINFQNLQAQVNVIYNAIHVKAIEVKALYSEINRLKEEILSKKDAMTEIQKIKENVTNNV